MTQLQEHHSATYSRRARSAFRVLEGRGLVASPGRAPAAIEGAALLVWYALEVPTTIDGVVAAIVRDFPELHAAPDAGPGGVTRSDVQHALDLLLDAGLVVVDGDEP